MKSVFNMQYQKLKIVIISLYAKCILLGICHLTQNKRLIQEEAHTNFGEALSLKHQLIGTMNLLSLSSWMLKSTHSISIMVLLNRALKILLKELEERAAFWMSQNQIAKIFSWISLSLTFLKWLVKQMEMLN